ncbi:MAG: M42 family peptidase [Oscillospiraceae bacterium]|nr:M42 family peptidase [Oscillospiraceae bacterium]
MLSHLQALCSIPGVSGDEGAVRDYVLDHVMPYDATVDALGNVIVRKAGARRSERTILLAAHMDEVGFIVTSITDTGFLKFAAVGGMDRRMIVGKRVRVGARGVPGVIGTKPVHLASADERKKAPEIAELYIDIGVSSIEVARALVAPGDTVWFDSPAFEMGGSFAARALDDRIGCAVLLQLIAEPLPVDVTFAFTVQEEVGCRGAETVSFRVKPDIALILEGTTAADLPGVPVDKQVCRLGGGVVVPFMDGGTVYDRGLYAQITGLADRLGIPHQTKNVIAGGTDAARIQRTGGGARVAALAAPVRNLHAGYNVACVRDMGCLLELTRAVLGELG